MLLRAEVCQRAESARQVLRLLAQGEKEIAEGYGTDLDTVLTEAAALLEADDL